MKLTKTLAACSILAASTGLSSMAMAESPLTGNVGFTSNYIWRGATQGQDEAAISGGIDYAHKSGAYAGVWTSSLSDNSYELDIYGGYGFEAGPVGLDVGYIQYMYPVGTNSTGDFSEAYVNGTWKMMSFGAAYTLDQDDNGNAGADNDLYIYVGADFEVAKGLNLGVLYGDYDIDGSSTDDYSHIQISLSKDDFAFTIDDTDQDAAAGDTRFTVSYSKGFDLL